MFDRPGTMKDYISIKPHLIVEYLESSENSMYRHSAAIEQSFASGGVIVAYGPRGVVGFSTLDALDDGRIWVRPDVRKEGIGSFLLRKKIERLERDGINFIQTQAATEASERLLRYSGFRSAIGGRAKEFRYLVREIKRGYEVPRNLHPVRIQVHAFPKTAKYTTGSVQPVFSAQENGRLFGNRILFEKRIALLPNEIDAGTIPLLKIIMDDRCIYFGKAKHPRAEALGVHYLQEDGSFYLDQINWPDHC